jgi:hypothetical protein
VGKKYIGLETLGKFSQSILLFKHKSCYAAGIKRAIKEDTGIENCIQPIPTG